MPVDRHEWRLEVRILHAALPHFCRLLPVENRLRVTAPTAPRHASAIHPAPSWVATKRAWKWCGCDRETEYE